MATMRKESWIYVGSAALTGGEALKFSSKGKVDVATAVTDKPVGIAAEACAAGNTVGQNIAVWAPYMAPTVQVIGSTTIAEGDYLSATTGGKMVTVTPKATYEASVAEVIWGYANEAAGSGGTDVIEMVWFLTAQSLT